MATQGPPTRLICPVTGPDAASMRRAMARARALGADAVELRLDHLDRLPTDEELAGLLAETPLETIVTCRPAREGGRYEGDEAARLGVLRRAAELGADWIDVEADVPPADRPAGRVILSRHDFAGCPTDLDDLAAALDASPADVSKVAFAADGPEDALRALDVLRAAKGPTFALAMGEPGLPSRILAAKFAAFGTFAALTPGAESAPGQPTLEELTGLYRFRHIGPDTAVFGVIGCPVAHSMSPAIHNAAFAAAGIDAVYLPLLIQPGEANFRRFLDALLARPWMTWRGLSVTIPHKENALAYVGEARCAELARRIGAVNTITIDLDGSLRGDNTDYAGALDALCEGMTVGREALAARRVAVLGAGGAARALVAALRHYGADVAIYNRTVARAERLGDEFGCAAAGLDALGRLDAEIVINCSSVGMHPDVARSPLERIPPGVEVVFDTVYNPVETLLLRRARAAGCTCVTGVDMFVNQAVAQFQTWTARDAPRRVMRDVVLSRLAAAH